MSSFNMGTDSEKQVYGSGADLPVPFESGIVLVDKPEGWTSFDVVKKLRGILGVRKIGHAGTLDPMATGLLVCCVGRATKDVPFWMGLEKEYTGRLRLGERTASYDRETRVELIRPWEHVGTEQIESGMKELEGLISQIPPMYAAIKVGGRRLYHAARKGEVVERPARQVLVSRFELVGRAGQDVDIRVVCSKGTYVRSLAHDLGERLGCGAHLVALRRTRVGTSRVEGAWTPASLQTYVAALRQRSESD